MLFCPRNHWGDYYDGRRDITSLPHGLSIINKYNNFYVHHVLCVCLSQHISDPIVVTNPTHQLSSINRRMKY